MSRWTISTLKYLDIVKFALTSCHQSELLHRLGKLWPGRWQLCPKYALLLRVLTKLQRTTFTNLTCAIFFHFYHQSIIKHILVRTSLSQKKIYYMNYEITRLGALTQGLQGLQGLLDHSLVKVLFTSFRGSRLNMGWHYTFPPLQGLTTHPKTHATHTFYPTHKMWARVSDPTLHTSYSLLHCELKNQFWHQSDIITHFTMILFLYYICVSRLAWPSAYTWSHTHNSIINSIIHYPV